MAIFKVKAELREDVGKGASRRLRHQDKVPAVLYGGDRDPRNIALEHHEVLHLIEDEAFFSSIIEFQVEGGQKQKVVIKDMQRHPARARILHMDFMRVDDKHKIVMQVPVHFEHADTCPAAKASGVILDFQMNEVEISCFPKDLPEFIAIDMSEFNVGDNLYLSDIQLPEGVTLTAFTHGDDEENNAVLVTTSHVAVEKAADDADAEAAAETAVKAEAKDAEKEQEKDAE